MKPIAPATFLFCLLVTWASCVFAQLAVRCVACDQVIEGKYIKIDGKPYHPDHFVCDYCLKPIREEYRTLNQRNYHLSCYEQHVVMVCYVCNRAIESDGMRDRWGNLFHAQHQNEYKQCDFCGRLIFREFVAGHRRFSDGRELCGQCAMTAVTTDAAAETLMTRAARCLAMDGIRVDVKDITVLLLNLDRMQTVTNTPGRHVSGATDYASYIDARGRIENRGGNFYLLEGMPEVEMLAVVAHELMHVWQGSRNPLQEDDILREGSANYAAYLVMRRIESKQSAFMIMRLTEDTDLVYGEGFRRVKHYADKHGVDGLIELIAGDHPVLADD